MRTRDISFQQLERKRQRSLDSTNIAANSRTRIAVSDSGTIAPGIQKEIFPLQRRIGSAIDVSARYDGADELTARVSKHLAPKLPVEHAVIYRFADMLRMYASASI
jgi:hypothetical protein